MVHLLPFGRNSFLFSLPDQHSSGCQRGDQRCKRPRVGCVTPRDLSSDLAKVPLPLPSEAAARRSLLGRAPNLLRLRSCSESVWNWKCHWDAGGTRKRKCSSALLAATTHVISCWHSVNEVVARARGKVASVVDVRVVAALKLVTNALQVSLRAEEQRNTTA